MPGDLLSTAVDEAFVPPPRVGRTYAGRRFVRLSDMDARGRLRLDAIARFLQDVAIDDVQETGWGLPEHLWFIRSIRVDVLSPFLRDREVRLLTWCSGLAAIAAGRRWTVEGDAGGRADVDSVWIHLGPDQRPARIEGFDLYAEATEGRSVSTTLLLPDPPAGASRSPWVLRATDIDRHGHVNNAAYWHAVEDRLTRGRPDPAAPLRALLEYRRPLDLGDAVVLADYGDGDALALGFEAGGDVRAVGRVEPLPTP